MATKKKQEVSIEDKLKRMFALQEIDSKLDEIEILKGELPIEVSDLEDEIVGLQTRISKLDGGVKEIEREVEKYQAKINESESLLGRYNKQLDDVKNNREYEALTKEIELQGLEIQLQEKKIKEANIKKEAKLEVYNEAEERIEKKNKDLKIKQVELKQIITKTEKEEVKLNKSSVSARKNIEERLLLAYDKIRRNYRNGLAVVTVQRDSCGGCFNKIPPQMQLEISMRKKIIVCEHCGRILVDNAIAGILEEV